MYLYRGTGKEGVKQIRASEDGVYGPGVYFYKDPREARSYSEPGGGIVVAHVNSEHVEHHGKVAVVKDPSHIRRVGIIPNEKTNNEGWSQQGSPIRQHAKKIIANTERVVRRASRGNPNHGPDGKFV